MWRLGLTVALGAILVGAGYSGGDGYSSGRMSVVGRCNPRVRADPSVNYELFATEYNGLWVFLKVPDSLSRIREWMHMHIDKMIYPRLYDRTIHYQLKNGTTGVLGRDIVYDHGEGYLTGYDSDGNYSELKMLAYVRNRFAYYYICSDKGGDFQTDYRFVIVHHGVTLTPQEEAYIAKLERSYQFRGSMRYLSSQGPTDGRRPYDSGYCGK